MQNIIVDTTPPEAFDDPGIGFSYIYAQPQYLSWHEFVEDRDRIVLREDCPVYIDVLSNDIDNCHAGLTVATAEVPAPSYGVTSRFTDGGAQRYPLLPNACNARVVRYSPYSDYTGPDEFGYTARDCSGNESSAMVYLFVFAKNSLESFVPNAVSGLVSRLRLETKDDLLLRIADSERFTYVFSLPTATRHGVLVWTDDAVAYDHSTGVASLDLAYISAEGYVGPDSFSWSVTDPFGLTQERTESFMVVARVPALAALEPALRLAGGAVAHLAVPAGASALSGAAGIRIEQLDPLGYVVTELTGEAVAAAVFPDPERGPHVLALDSGKLPEGLLRLLIPVGDGTMCSVVVEVRGGGGQ